ncbi:Fe-S cluster assembly protein SufD [Elioraea sp.]|uniref:Fe-S cluster assembly protein SufD n=1 Tax=Elioraea sp. TaxID=2185103 RepID=UPI0025C1CC71|nr:Fe-S cluster assembly protein SufD [Elioraea sp.]
MTTAVIDAAVQPAALVHPAVAAALARHEALAKRLPGHRHGWIREMREDAAAAFARAGFPTRRNEEWHYTDPRALVDTRFGEPIVAADGAVTLPGGMPDAGAPKLMFVDGRFRPDLSELAALPDGVRVESLAALLEAGDEALSLRLGSLADRSSFVALNAMLAEDGVVITCTAAPDAGARVHLVSIATASGDRPLAFHQRHVVSVAEGASLALFESAHAAGATPYFNNTVAEITLGARARMTHVRLQAEALGAFQVSTVFAHLAAGAEYDSFVLAAGARLARNEVHARLEGTGAIVHLNGAQLGDGVRHVDTTTVITHAAPACASRQTFKSVLSGRSRAVFQGKIHVHQVAQKTDGYQMNQALLLSPESEIDAKPQLEIYADDVKCSHGATVGELDANQLFYLRSRGIPAPEARAMLIEAFLADALEAVRDERLRAALADATALWWARAHAEAGA